MKSPENYGVLVVDDEEGIRNSLCASLSRKGYRVFSAENGRAAARIVQSEAIDLVISDIRMPDGDGIELLSSLKSRDPELPVIVFITGFADISAEDAFDQGADAMLSKPFGLKALHATVQKALTHRKERWQKTDAGDKAEAKGVLRFQKSGIRVDAKVASVGRGGMFVETDAPLPPDESMVDFDLSITAAPGGNVSGSGVVQWVRRTASEGRPVGCGVEFLKLEGEGLFRLLELIDRLRPKAFIPSR